MVLFYGFILKAGVGGRVFFKETFLRFSLVSD